MRAGDLTKPAIFQRPQKDKDADGKVVPTYLAVFETMVHLKPLRGGESVMASRMQSRAPAIVTFYAFDQARAVTSEWRVVIDGRIYDAKEDPRETQDRALFEMLVEGGGNAGR